MILLEYYCYGYVLLLFPVHSRLTLTWTSINIFRLRFYTCNFSLFHANPERSSLIRRLILRLIQARWKPTSRLTSTNCTRYVCHVTPHIFAGLLSYHGCYSRHVAKNGITLSFRRWFTTIRDAESGWMQGRTELFWRRQKELLEQTNFKSKFIYVWSLPALFSKIYHSQAPFFKYSPLWLRLKCCSPNKVHSAHLLNFVEIETSFRLNMRLLTQKFHLIRVRQKLQIKDLPVIWLLGKFFWKEIHEYPYLASWNLKH